jgi:hypothetical protein
MPHAAPPEVWSEAQVAARFDALRGSVPAPLGYAIFRSTTTVSGAETSSYHLPGVDGPQGAQSFENWLILHRLAAADRLAVSVLVIQETLDTGGAIRDCTLERRHGSAAGPFSGDPARVEFSGATCQVWSRSALPNGHLAEVNADPEVPCARQLGRPRNLGLFEGEEQALRAAIGPSPTLLDHREACPIEARIGLSSIVHLRRVNGAMLNCGIGWHGPLPYVLVANFPRLPSDRVLSPADEAAVVATIAAYGLVRHENRLDATGSAVMARTPESDMLFILRPFAGIVHIEPYRLGRSKHGTADQQRWIGYAESYEGRIVLDVYPNETADEIIVLTGGVNGDAWRHHIDADGVETAREPGGETAAAAIHRKLCGAAR